MSLVAVRQSLRRRLRALRRGLRGAPEVGWGAVVGEVDALLPWGESFGVWVLFTVTAGLTVLYGFVR